MFWDVFFLSDDFEIMQNGHYESRAYLSEDNKNALIYRLLSGHR